MSAAPTCVALVDCNNFFASCERMRRPDLDNVPVAVLSSNDGCIIARSEEVKALGIPMGMPYFQAKDLIKQHNVALFSLNYTLYTETSARIMKLLQESVPAVQVYSVDEAFLDLSGMERYFDLDKFLQSLRKKIWDEIRIPVSIGVAPTKALAKLANRIAKKKKSTYVEFLMNPEDQIAALDKTKVEDIWGVGRRNAKKLQALGINSGLELRNLGPSAMRRIGSVVEVRLVRELRGESSLLVETDYDPKRHIASSRSFGQRITTVTEMKDALTFLLSIAMRKLHRQRSAAGAIHVSFSTARNNEPKPSVCKGFARLPIATDYPPILLQQVLQLVEEIFKPGHRYARAQVTFYELEPATQVQGSLFIDPNNDKQRRVIDLVNQLNKDKGGQNIVNWAAFNLKDTHWMPKSEYRSPHQVTLKDEDMDIARPWW